MNIYIYILYHLTNIIQRNYLFNETCNNKLYNNNPSNLFPKVITYSSI